MIGDTMNTIVTEPIGMCQLTEEEERSGVDVPVVSMLDLLVGS